MNKILYSLVLSKDVVDEIDRLAYSMHTNRSNMINQILAEYVSYVTPEKRIKQIFDILENRVSMSAVFQALDGGDSVFRLRSAISYKYNPMVNYTLELYKKPSSGIGAIKASVRTQNETLLRCLLNFFSLWSELERTYGRGGELYIEDGKMIKSLLSGGDANDPDILASEIYRYIDHFDKAMKNYIILAESKSQAAAETAGIYFDYLNNSKLIL